MGEDAFIRPTESDRELKGIHVQNIKVTLKNLLIVDMKYNAKLTKDANNCVSKKIPKWPLNTKKCSLFHSTMNIPNRNTFKIKPI